MRINFFKRGGKAPEKEEKVKINITGINLKFRGDMHTTDGVKSASSVFDVAVPFTNRPYSNYLTDYLTEAHVIKASDFEPISIKAIEAAAPFKVLSVEPPVPRKVGPEERVEFKIKVQGPELNYSGPMTLNFVEDNEDIIHLELTKVLLDYSDKKVEAENGLVMLNMPKNHIFQQNIQLLKILDYGTRIENVSVDKPFLFVGSKPKLPFVVNDTSSFVLSLYIRAPDSSYSGPMEIKLS